MLLRRVRSEAIEIFETRIQEFDLRELEGITLGGDIPHPTP
jgi:hypothetical protein